MSMSQLDPGQIIKTAFEDSNAALKVRAIAGGLVPEVYDELALTYVAAGPGTGEIATVVYKLLGSTIATLTLGYDGSNRLNSVVRS